jgi:hypothetical protein
VPKCIAVRQTRAEEPSATEVTTIGLDLAKRVFQVHGVDFRDARRSLLPEVMESYRQLEAQCDLVVVEGAGSPAEINLRAGDIANMGFARAAQVPVVLVGDIDRGGVIAAAVPAQLVLPQLRFRLALDLRLRWRATHRSSLRAPRATWAARKRRRDRCAIAAVVVLFLTTE